MIKEPYKYLELTSKMIGFAITVHSSLGNGFTHLFNKILKGIRECFVFQACLPKGSTARRQEVIYQRALEIEMADKGLSFSREMEMPIYYRNQRIGTRRVDFLVEGIVCVVV